MGGHTRQLLGNARISSILIVAKESHESSTHSAYILKAKKFAEPPFQSKKRLRKNCINPGVNISRQMRVNLAFKILRQKVRKSPHQYFATKVRKLRFQIPTILAFRMYASTPSPPGSGSSGSPPSGEQTFSTGLVHYQL